MSLEKVNVVRGMYAAFAKGEIPTIIAALDEMEQSHDQESSTNDPRPRRRRDG